MLPGLILFSTVLFILACSGLAIQPLRGNGSPWHTIKTLPTFHTPLTFLGIYAGSLPKTFPMTVASMRSNPDSSFVALHVGNEEPWQDLSLIASAGDRPANFFYVHLSEKRFEEEFLSRVKVQLNTSILTGHQLGQNHKINDIRVAAPKLFADKLGPEVQFWGFLEFDLVYGRLNALYQKIQTDYDVWSGMSFPNGIYDRVSAPLMLMRTGKVTDRVMDELLQDAEVFRDPAWRWLDERGISAATQQIHDVDIKVNFFQPGHVPEGLQPHDICFPSVAQRVRWSPSNGPSCDGREVFAIHFSREGRTAGQTVSPEKLQAFIKSGWALDHVDAPDGACRLAFSTIRDA